jgi:branched-chain amino acid transport system substrate-binding protein
VSRKPAVREPGLPGMVQRLLPLCLGVAVVGTSLAACSSSGSTGATAAAASGSSSCQLPSVVQAVEIKSLTGSAGFVGIDANKGIQLAASQINSQHVLGSKTTLQVKAEDDQGNAQSGAQDLTSAISDSSVVAVLGPVLSNVAVATSPIAEKAGMPIIYTQSGSSGVLIGKYTFRATPPMTTFYYKLAEYLQAKGVKKLSVIYSSDNDTLDQLATQTLPALGKQYGFSVSLTATQSTTQDFASPVTKLLSNHPDAVDMLVIDTQIADVMQQLHQQDFTGPVTSYEASLFGLEAMGTSGAGVVWPSNYSVTATASSQAFTSAFKAKYGSAPTNFAAEAYDSAWWLADAIKAEHCATRSAIQAGLESVKGLSGAQGNLTFTDNDARVAGYLIQWNGKAAVQIQP